MVDGTLSSSLRSPRTAPFLFLSQIDQQFSE
jgi:hypothetical protein